MIFSDHFETAPFHFSAGPGPFCRTSETIPQFPIRGTGRAVSCSLPNIQIGRIFFEMTTIPVRCCVYKDDGRKQRLRENKKKHTVQEDKKMKTYETELNLNQMAGITGGTNNNNPNPGKMDPGIDGIINGKNYDAIAQWIANWLNGDNKRSRKVNNNVDIYDTAI